MNRNDIVDRNRLLIMSIEDSLIKRTDKAVISKWSAAAWWGFSELIDFKFNVTFPKGQNFPIDKEYFDINWKAESKYSIGIETFKIEDMDINVYSPERTIVELVKDAKGSFNDVLVKVIKNFFSKKYDYKKLMRYADIFNVKKEMNVFAVMANE